MGLCCYGRLTVVCHKKNQKVRSRHTVIISTSGRHTCSSAMHFDHMSYDNNNAIIDRLERCVMITAYANLLAAKSDRRT